MALPARTLLENGPQTRPGQAGPCYYGILKPTREPAGQDRVSR